MQRGLPGQPLGGRMNNMLCSYYLMFLQFFEPAESVKRQGATWKSSGNAVIGH